MPRTNEIGSHKTVVFTDDEGMTNVVYHRTAVVKFNYERIVLNTGGWHTATTKLRMNQTSNQFGLGYYVYQKNYEWFVEFDGEVIPFEDRMVLERAQAYA